MLIYVLYDKHFRSTCERIEIFLEENMFHLLKKTAMAVAMLGVITLGVSVYTAQPAEAYYACPYGPGIAVGRNHIEDGKIVGYWTCDCYGNAQMVYGRTGTYYHEFITGFCSF